jgi:hypothetical protein
MSWGYCHMNWLNKLFALESKVYLYCIIVLRVYCSCIKMGYFYTVA